MDGKLEEKSSFREREENDNDLDNDSFLAWKLTTFETLPRKIVVTARLIKASKKALKGVRCESGSLSLDFCDSFLLPIYVRLSSNLEREMREV